jgi:hypothetical protein
MSNRQNLAREITDTLGGTANGFDVEAIIDNLIRACETPHQPLTSIDQVDTVLYWNIVQAHDPESCHSEAGYADADARESDSWE